MANSNFVLRRWLMTFICTCINLCFPIYSWSVIKGEITKKMEANDPDWTWGVAYLNAPYSLASLVIGCAAYPAGYCYDRFGPRIVTSAGSVVMFIGLFLCSLSSSLYVWMIGFGLFTGLGFSAVYCSQLPTALKWFPSKMSGLVAAIVVSGAGISPAYLSPLMLWMSSQFGLLMAMRGLSIMYFVFILVLAQFLHLPPTMTQISRESAPQETSVSELHSGPSLSFLASTECDWRFAEAVRTRAMWLSCLGFFLGAGVGVMMIGEGAALATEALGKDAWLSLVVLSFGNVGGRVVAGIMNDRIGLRKALVFFFSLQALTMLGLVWVRKDSAIGIMAVAASVGFNYGAQPCLWFVAIKFFYGTKAYGEIFGIFSLSGGIGGLIFSNIGQALNSSTGSITASAMMAFVLLLIGIVLVLFLETPIKRLTRQVTAQLVRQLSVKP